MPAQRSPHNRAALQGILLLLLATLIALALATHKAERPACGPLADWVAETSLAALGPILAWAVWQLFPLVAIGWLMGRRKLPFLPRALPVLVLAAVCSVILSPTTPSPGRRIPLFT